MPLILIRGLPGAGKTTLAHQIGGHPVAADDYFTNLITGEYRFDFGRIKEAHNWCFARTMRLLGQGKTVIVHNTFSRRWEMQRYLERCISRPTVVDLFDNGLTDEELAHRCVHGVSVEIISKMRARWEHDWGAASPTRTEAAS